MIKLQHLQQFLVVKEQQSLSEAAKILHRSPSAVSMTLKQMEDELGQALFEGDRKQVLTPLGQYVATCALRAVGEYQKSISDINQFAKGDSGLVKVSAVPSVATCLMPSVMIELQKARPHVQIDLRDIDSVAVARTVCSNEVDFGIASQSAETVDLDVELLTEEPFMCVFPEGHALGKHQKNNALKCDDIGEYSFIANGLIDQINNVNIQALSDLAQLRVRNITSILAFVRAGLGVTLLPRMATLLAPDLQARPLYDESVKRRLYLLTPKGRSLSPAAELLKEGICKQTLSNPRE